MKLRTDKHGEVVIEHGHMLQPPKMVFIVPIATQVAVVRSIDRQKIVVRFFDAATLQPVVKKKVRFGWAWQ